MYIYYALINAQSVHMIHINYDILYTCRSQSYQNNLHKVLYRKTNTHTDTHHTYTHTRTQTAMISDVYDIDLYHTSYMRTYTYAHAHTHTHTHTRTRTH